MKANNLDLSQNNKNLYAYWHNFSTCILESSSPLSVCDIQAIHSQFGNNISFCANEPQLLNKTYTLTLKLDEPIDITEQYEILLISEPPVKIAHAPLYNSKAFDQQFTYHGDLGPIYTPEKTHFKVWSPTASSIAVNLYRTGDGETLLAVYSLQKKSKGLFELTLDGDFHGIYYTYTLHQFGKKIETHDIYAKASGVNGHRSMVVNLEKTNPIGWHLQKKVTAESPVDIVVYETHIRDFTIHPSSGATHKGKFLSVCEPNTQTTTGIKTGMAHLKELGISHVQLLPFFDYNSVDETRFDANQYNWGYDPLNYNVPEGSYATNPYDGSVRIMELKTMIQNLHNEGIGVIMDVVYNHTANTHDSSFNKLVPEYYYRMNQYSFSDASACGNETASEKPMMQNFLIHSLTYWATEYQIDGFRFDLMGIHDTETMRKIEKALRKVKPDIILYGEGWTGGDSTLDENQRLIKQNISSIPGIGAFNDDARDGIKGHVFEPESAGFVSGANGFEDCVKFGIVGATCHPQIDYRLLNYCKNYWAISPEQSINYVEAHDNLTLWDKLNAVEGNFTNQERISMARLSNAIVLTSQGVPFMQLGMDFLRSKQGEHNSYNLPDSINQIDWNRKEMYYDFFQYIQGLIAIRKKYNGFRLKSTSEIVNHLKFFEKLPKGIVGFTIQPPVNKTTDENIIIFFNGTTLVQKISVPLATYTVLANHQNANASGVEVIQSDLIEIKPYSAWIATY